MIPFDKKEQKRLHSLIGKTWYCGEVAARNVSGYKFLGNSQKQHYLRILMAHKMLNDHEFTEEEKVAYWHEISRTRRESYKLYKMMPRPPRKDNKDYINYGSGGGSYSWLRYPKKVRKTAWKRFLKLFPFAKDKR